MAKFPIVITEVDEKGTRTEQIMLEAEDSKDKNQRTKAINEYLREKEFPVTCICFGCDKGPLTCKKVADISKKMIFDYPFITEGFQVQDLYQSLNDISFIDKDASDYEKESRKNSLRIEKFVVTKCENYTYATRPTKKIR